MATKDDKDEYMWGQAGVRTGSLMNDMGLQAHKASVAAGTPSSPARRTPPRPTPAPPATPSQKDMSFLGLLCLAVAAAMGWWDHSAGWTLPWWGHAAAVILPAAAVGLFLRQYPRLVRTLRWLVTASVLFAVVAFVANAMQS